MEIDPSQLSCPAASEVDPEDLTIKDCGVEVAEVTGPGERVDQVPFNGVPSEPMPGCCYPVLETEPSCNYGRPLKVEAQALRSSLVEDPTWAASLRLRPLPTEARHALAERWCRSALDEHASIAAFSRVALDLLRLGAPPELIEQAHAAALDEVRHAKQGFAIASALMGAPVGPGAFPLGMEVSLSAGLAEVAAEAAEDGCIGEALASLLAREAAAICEEPEIRAVLLGIAEDEERHSLLGWRTVIWALRVGGPDVRAAVANVFDRASRMGVAVPLTGDCDDPAVLAQVGLLDREASRRTARRALAEVILPAARAILGRPVDVQDQLAGA
ncbi:ferritin-like domain-containing protein [Polyangium sp. y55x31]|uniref:ferritin-like domain-containing protein n=1 Tax=Polyangium sp. y55x31 TaxID=3042688 RepID=UPI0024831DD3|nr:ferritin-like domain-containing protein [Polyangium sp. y55x31]MDI1476251.1 ferritin-like domain-containing protein [Polyangium sp. y55x31]